jgi:hypothetical protein
VRAAPIEYSTVHERLRAVLPEFGDTIDEHIVDYDDVLAHVLFGDLTRFVLDARQRGDDELVARCLAFLDQAMRDGDDQVVNLVQVSFVENIGPWNDDIAAFVESWPEPLKREVERQRNWKPGDPGPVGML